MTHDTHMFDVFACFYLELYPMARLTSQIAQLIYHHKLNSSLEPIPIPSHPTRPQAAARSSAKFDAATREVLPVAKLRVACSRRLPSLRPTP